jgi:two-component system sensor histidine kinase/response regulator
MIKKFVRSQAMAIATIRLALQAADFSTAERTAHTLKGLSGTLGASALQMSAGVLESTLRKRTTASATESAMRHTETELDQLIRALQAVPGLVASEPHSVLALTESQRQVGQLTLERIKELLHQSNAGVLDVWQNHAATLLAMLDNAADIEAAINDFDFEIALQLIENNALSVA